MKMRSILLSVVLITLLAAACRPAAPTADKMMQKPTVEKMMDKPTEEAMMETPTVDTMMDKPTEDAMMDKPTDTPKGDMMTTPAWYSAAFTDAHTTDSFSIESFKGKVVLVETMAIWCPNCKKQQMEVKTLIENLGMRDDFVTIGLDVDTQESQGALKSYVESNGFDWFYSVAGEDVTREISNLYSAQFLNPPSTPILIIDRKGEAHPLPFGIKSAADLQKAVEQYLNQDM